MTKRIDGFERVGELYRESSDPRPAAREAARAELLARCEAKAEESAPPARRARFSVPRRARLAFVAGCTALLVAAAAFLTSGDVATPAYAIETQPGGGLEIEIYRLDEPEGVERVLEESGVASQVSYLEAGMTCREPHYKPSMATFRTLQGGAPQPWAGFNYESISGPLTILIADLEQRRKLDGEIRQAWRRGDSSEAARPTLWIDPTGFRPDQTLVISSAPTPADYQQPIPDAQEGRIVRTTDARIDSLTQVRVAEGEVGSCEPVPAADGEVPIRAPEGGWDFSEVPYAGWGF